MPAALPLLLPGAEWSKLLEEVVVTGPFGLRHFLEDANDLFPDGLLPGQVDLKGDAEVDFYTDPERTDLRDYEKIFNPQYEELVRMGQAEAPISQYWLQLLRVPGEFTRLATAFRKALQRGAKKGKPETAEPEPTPEPSEVY